MSSTKICRTCGKEKVLDEFPKDKRWRGTYKLDCRSCFNAKRRLNYNPEERRKSGLLQNYNITYEEVCVLYAQQNGCCAICNTHISLVSGKTKKGKAHVDHCHTTGKVRGLLCTKCNTLLGMASDKVSILQKAIVYLDRSQDD